MDFFDFHHHKKGHYGIYHLHLMEEPCEKDYFSVGIHPLSISEDWESSWEWVKKCSQHKNCLAIGELWSGWKIQCKRESTKMGF